jgi:hypothetical protein
MIPSVQLECVECRQGMVIVPPTMGQFKGPTDAPPIVELPTVPEGWKLIEADGNNVARCPECGAENDAPGLESR